MLLMIKQSNKYLIDFYENAPDMFLSIDSNTQKIILCNNALEKETGFAKSELLNKYIFELYDPKCLEAANSIFDECKRLGEVDNALLYIKRKDGNAIRISQNIKIIHPHFKDIEYVCVWRDISKEEEIVKTKEKDNDLLLRINKLYKDAPIGVGYIDNFYKFVLINETLSQILGGNSDQFMQKRKKFERSPVFVGQPLSA